jgi:hypothetical protein
MKRALFIILVLFSMVSISAASEGNPEDILCRTVKSISICNPITYKNLTIFPLAISKGRDNKSIITLDEAFKKGYVEIMEKASSEVNTVVLVNKSKYYVFILAGEVITGCKQDRMVSEDCLIPPHSGKIYLSVYCTEHGRWTAKSNKFATGGIATSPGMRETAKATKSQSEVWAKVEEERTEAGAAPSPTDAYMDIIHDKDVERELKPYMDKFSGIPGISGWKTVGVLAAIGDEIIVVDLFTNHKLFEKLWEKLIKSYAMDAINRSQAGTLSKNDVRNFLNELGDVTICTRDTDGTGDAYTIDADRAFGTTIIFDKKVVHLDLFPRYHPCPTDPVPMLDFRREKSR